MPITLGCPSCGKRFRARDESAGKRVKCPYCSAPVSVPTPEESAAASAPTDALPKPPTNPGSLPPLPGRPVPAPQPASVASPADWGAPPSSSSEAPLPNPFATDATGPASRPSTTKPVPKPAPKSTSTKAVPTPSRPFGASAAGEESPEQLAARAWRKTRRGLGWVLFGLFFIALPAFAEFGKEVYVRSAQGTLPSGPGDDWIKIDGYINSGGKSVTLDKQELLNVACYGVPLLFGGLFLFLGRLRAGAAPRSSGAKGLFCFSGLFTLVAVTGLWAYLVCVRMAKVPGEFPADLVAGYGELAFLICGLTAEFWFLTGLTASGLALKRPKVARAVGLIGFVVALAVALLTAGWEIYARELRPTPLTPDWRFYEYMALMIGWLLVVGVYWRAVSSTRVAIRDYLETVEE
jgi:hypothetical protein